MTAIAIETRRAVTPKAVPFMRARAEGIANPLISGDTE
jgi:hypothetical protein